MMRTPAQQIAAAVAALDEARRAIEAISATPCGDDEVDEALTGIMEEIDGDVGHLYSLSTECVPDAVAKLNGEG